MTDRETKEKLARANGFESYAEMIAKATPLPDDGSGRSFLVVDPNGRWFIWRDEDDEQTGSTPPPAASR